MELDFFVFIHLATPPSSIILLICALTEAKTFSNSVKTNVKLKKSSRPFFTISFLKIRVMETHIERKNAGCL